MFPLQYQKKAFSSPVTYLQEKSYCSPRESSVSRIILHGRISNLFEFVYPIHDLFTDVVQVDTVSIASLILQSSSETVLLLRLDLLEHID